MDWHLQYQRTHPEGHGVNGALSGSITYSADTPAEAVASALRWMRGREALGTFLYFQISPHVIGPIDAAGNLLTRTGMRIMEWSQDRAGVDKETYCDWKIAEYSRKSEQKT